ncbi:MAG: N-formylglutamate amidohydrolase [Azospirillaceae bacterium]|nr:N-formylglutamate amidohydrolase [Azospirillaceae bacterium]
MDAQADLEFKNDAAFEIVAPGQALIPLVLASPHSGTRYAPAFLAAARLSSHALRKSEDSFVDEIFDGSRQCGAPLIKALFPRAFVDANREAFELDPEMFVDALPAYVNSRSPRVLAGLGTVARIVGTGQEIYREKLRFADVLQRINQTYHPYHRALQTLIEQTRQGFGTCLLIDCHSMPSNRGLGDPDPAHFGRADFVLGDCYGTACATPIIDAAENILERCGYRVMRNTPYAGGFTTRHYGRPRHGVHALQIEINRELYMDEATLVRKPFLDTLRHQMTALITALGGTMHRLLRPPSR